MVPSVVNLGWETEIQLERVVEREGRMPDYFTENILGEL